MNSLNILEQNTEQFCIVNFQNHIIHKMIIRDIVKAEVGIVVIVIPLKRGCFTAMNCIWAGPGVQ